MTPQHIQSPQWTNATAIARQACARIFRDGGKPGDALAQFGLPIAANEATDWSRAVDRIAQSLCSQRERRAA
jgi:hypothetical protein